MHAGIDILARGGNGDLLIPRPNHPLKKGEELTKLANGDIAN
jgi:hypothetical protein